MSAQPPISDATIDRLPLYYRALVQLEQIGHKLTSSEYLGEKLDISPEQIRKDLNVFGQFGKKGTGYYVDELKAKIASIIGLDQNLNIAIVGLRGVGMILANDEEMFALGYNLAALFDNDAKLVGATVAGVKVQNTLWIRRTSKERRVHIGIIAVDAMHAQNAADELIAGGVKGIWNFAPIKLEVPTNIHVVREDLAISLTNLSYHVTHQ